MDKKEGVDWLMNQYKISESEAEDCYRVTVDMANFCFNEYIKHIQTGKSGISPLIKEGETLSDFLKRSKERDS